jgi:hypothetical protein
MKLVLDCNGCISKPFNITDGSDNKKSFSSLLVLQIKPKLHPLTAL